MTKSIVKTALTASLFFSVANADMTHFEMGAGAWMQTPSGTSTYNSGGTGGTNTLNEDKKSSPYVWMLVKHPIPVLPNIRLEYFSINAPGKASGKWGDLSAPVGTPSTLDLKEYDIIPYYNIIDNSMWTTVDIGVDIKVIDADYKVSANGLFTGYEDKETVAVPMAYLRTRVEIPKTNIGIEADGKYISYDGSKAYDARAKVDYTFDLKSVVQPAVEIGYRVHKIKIDDSSADVKSDIDFKGMYAGLMLRF